MKRCETLLLVILFSCVCIFGCDRVQQIGGSVVEPPIAVDLNTRSELSGCGA